MKRERTVWITVVVGLFIVLLLVLQQKCEGEPTSTKKTVREVPYTIPEQNGGFEKPSNQDELPLAEPDTVFINGKPIYLQSPINEQLKKDLAKAQDSLQLFELLLEANRKRKFKSEFEDEYVKIDAYTTTYGTLEQMQVYYTLKERVVPVKETTIETTTIRNDNFGFLAGAGIKQRLDQPKVNAELQAGVRVKKLSVLATINTNKEAGLSTIIEF